MTKLTPRPAVRQLATLPGREGNPACQDAGSFCIHACSAVTFSKSSAVQTHDTMFPEFTQYRLLLISTVIGLLTSFDQVNSIINAER
jgi:hypothetical protein